MNGLLYSQFVDGRCVSGKGRENRKSLVFGNK